MRRPCIRRISAVAGLLLAVLAPAAQAADPSAEFTPFVGYRAGGKFDFTNPQGGPEQSVDLQSDASFGLDVGMYRDSNSFYELLYSRQQAGLDTRAAALHGLKLNVEYLQFGGTVLYPQEDQRLVPYLSLTLGATRFAADSGGYDSSTKVSASLGGGVRMPFSKNVAATLGLRGYLTFVASNTQFLCVSGSAGAGCLLKTTGSTVFQGEAQLGLTFRF